MCYPLSQYPHLPLCNSHRQNLCLFQPPEIWHSDCRPDIFQDVCNNQAKCVRTVPACTDTAMLYEHPLSTQKMVSGHFPFLAILPSWASTFLCLPQVPNNHDSVPGSAPAYHPLILTDLPEFPCPPAEAVRTALPLQADLCTGSLPRTAWYFPSS